MQVECPRCKVLSEYTPRGHQERQRKTCCCGHKFSVFVKTTQRTRQPVPPGVVQTCNLDQLDQLVVQLVQQQKSQVEIAQLAGVHKSTICRRVARLVQNGILGNRGTYPRYYTVSKILQASPPPATLNATTAHSLQVKCPIVGGTIPPPPSARKSRMHNWAAFYLQENNLTITVTTKSVVFWMSGSGITPDDAINNAKYKAMQVREYLQDTYNCQLGAPDFKWETGFQDADLIPITTTPEHLEVLKTIWSDDSDPACIEASLKGGKRFVEDVIHVTKDVQDLKQDIPAQLLQMRSDISNLADQVMQLVGVLKGAFAAPPMTPKAPPNTYI